jgi:hypothetical protein
MAKRVSETAARSSAAAFFSLSSPIGFWRLKEQNDIGENPRRNGRFFVGLEICGLVGLNGGRDRDRTCDPLDVNEVLSR